VGAHLRLSAFRVLFRAGQPALTHRHRHDDLDLYKTTETKNFNPNFSRIGTGSVADITDFSTRLLKFMLPQRRRVDYVYLQDEWTFVTDWTLTAGCATTTTPTSARRPTRASRWSGMPPTT
jgi:iron complex outermembrane receptor protein